MKLGEGIFRFYFLILEWPCSSYQSRCTNQLGQWTWSGFSPPTFAIQMLPWTQCNFWSPDQSCCGWRRSCFHFNCYQSFKVWFTNHGWYQIQDSGTVQDSWMVEWSSFSCWKSRSSFGFICSRCQNFVQDLMNFVNLMIYLI